MRPCIEWCGFASLRPYVYPASKRSLDSPKPLPPGPPPCRRRPHLGPQISRKSLKHRSWRLFGSPKLFFELPAASGSDFRSLWAPTWLRRGLRRPPGSILGAILAHFPLNVDVFRLCFCVCFRCMFRLMFSLFFFKVPSLSGSARKRRTCEKCNTLHAKTCFFKVRSRAGAARKTNKFKQKATKQRCQK